MNAFQSIRILDLTHGVAGPYSTMILGDLGCDVLKVERPGRGDASRYMNVSDRFLTDIPLVGGDYFMAINRNKRSVTIDFKDSRGIDVVRRLADNVDIVVQNFRPGVVDRLGIGPADLMARNPRLIYASLNAYGDEGPIASHPGMDVAVQARSGVMSITGHGGPEGPVKPGVSLADFSGGVHLSLAIIAALFQRQSTGKGEDVRVSLLDATMSMLINYSVAVTDGRADIAPMGSGHPQLAPFEAIATADGYVVVAPGTNRLFADLCRLLGREDLLRDERFSSNPLRVKHRPALIAELEPIFKGRTTAEWLDALEKAGVPCAPVNTLKQAFADEQLLANGMIQSLEHPTLGTVTQLGSPYRLGGRQPELRRHPPRLGEHTDAVLSELLGLGPDELEQLHQDGVI
ncbi:CoA transferase [Dactylosporangium sp. AC04546]|uniref:CaiB/BaiF CoA transferase family protein n=1 Tax=Dactylosporangium sp. AC04546 TaxID=2862460 RepID=UPI001EDCFC2A|nr:CoA transferase [Dactylosporangium sp. AC04546]WVK80895.1 CoA transferase [Dactylosporangium sp. AC04546]